MTPELSIELDEPERRYGPGDEVRGTVRVRGGDAVDIALDWITEGRGDAERHEVVAERLRDGPGGESDATHAFCLVMPEEPRSYDGALFRLAFQLRAVAAVTEGDDALATLPIATETRLPPIQLDPASCGSTIFDRGCLGCSALLVLQPVGWVLGGNGFASFGGALFCLLACLGLLGFTLCLPTVMAEQRIGRVRIDLTPPARGGSYRAASPGLLCRVRFRARVPEPPTVRATLLVREMTRTGEGSTTRTLRHVLFESGASLVAVRAGDHQARLPLPPPGSAPPAFSGGHTSVTWEVRVAIDIPDWPDWTQTIPLATRVGPAA